VSKIEMLFLSRDSIKETTKKSNKGIKKQSMFGSSIGGNTYVNQGQQQRELHNEYLERLMDHARQSRNNYLIWLQNQEDTARRESERVSNHLFIQAYGEIQQAEPLEREAEAFVVEEAHAEVCECSGCLENQANQQAHMEPGGCLYQENDEENYWGELGPPPPPPVLERQTAECISNDEVIVLNGNNIVCE